MVYQRNTYYMYVQQHWPSNKKPGYCPRLDFLFDKECVPTNFSTTAPECLVSPAVLRLSFLCGFLIERHVTVVEGVLKVLQL